MGRSSASSAQRLLTSRIQLSREQEWALIRVVQHRQKLKELADALRAQGKACSMGDVAVLAGMSGGEQELLMLEQLSQDATDMVMSASMRLAMSVAGRYSCAEGMTYEDLIPYSLKVRIATVSCSITVIQCASSCTYSALRCLLWLVPDWAGCMPAFAGPGEGDVQI